MYSTDLKDLPPVAPCLPPPQPQLSSCTAAGSQSPAPSSELYWPSLALSTAPLKYLQDKSQRTADSQHIRQRHTPLCGLDQLGHVFIRPSRTCAQPLISDRSDWEQGTHPGSGHGHSYTELCCPGELNSLSLLHTHTMRLQYLTPPYPPA